MLEHALAYAGRGWRIFPVHTTAGGACSCGRPTCTDQGKHPRIKAWQKHGTTDREQIERWWSRWPDANIGIACGGGLIVLDLDGAGELAAFVAIAKPHGGLPSTLTARTGRGFHLYLSGELLGSRKVDGLLVRGEGGYVIAPPSLHASGKLYQWVRDVPLAQAPDWFLDWCQKPKQNTDFTKLTTSELAARGGVLSDDKLPAYVLAKHQPNQGAIGQRASAALETVEQTAHERGRICSALASIPANCTRDPWLHVGMSLHSLNWQDAAGDAGFRLWAAWSQTGGDKFQGLPDLETRWRSFKRGGISIGTLYHIATQHGWLGYAPAAKEVMPNSHVSTNDTRHDKTQPHPADLLGGAHHLNGHHLGATDPTIPANEQPLIRLNTDYCAIGDVGGKCLVMGWVPSKVDPANQIPSFQTFKAFSERYGHEYVTIQEKGMEEPVQKQLGPYWLKWRHRKTYDGIDLIPGGPHVVGKTLNLWRGFAVKPIAPDGRDGLSAVSWKRMQAHMAEVLAGGDRAAFEYIVKWSAWAVQHPGERAETAMVFRGGKGSGKGTFAHALRRLFGAHGLHIANSKHLVGSFNAHLRNCLLLYADEAFWAGDKQGESTLKALITEPTLTIEQKGVDAVQWHNRIHLIMTANAEWVVPASREERRYAVFDVSEKYLGDRQYFGALHHEIANGGLPAMLHDLQRFELGDWHPREVVKTAGLAEQKRLSMNPMQEWWEAILQDGAIPAANANAPDTAAAHYLLNHFREFAPRWKDTNPTRLGRFLSDHGCIKLHRANGNAWRFAPLHKAREIWERQFGGWRWDMGVEEWAIRT